jgi:AraC-like DNA-binding protein
MVQNQSTLLMNCPPSPAYISSGKSAFSPGEVHVERIFPTFVAMFICEGTVFFTEDSVAYELQTGEWYIQKPGVRHFGHKASAETASYYWIHFMPMADWSIIEMNSESTTHRFDFNIIDTGEGVRVPAFMLSFPMNHTYPADQWGFLLEELVKTDPLSAQGLLIRLFSNMCSIQKNNPQSGMDILAENVKAYIHENYMNAITVKSIAQSFHFAPDYMNRCFRQRFGTAISDYLTNVKMNDIRNKLISTGKSIQDIAAEIGYKDLAVFSRMFKRNQGVSPSYYRQKTWSG